MERLILLQTLTTLSRYGWSSGKLTIVTNCYQVEAKGLKPLTTYNYQFTVCDSDTKSPIGRTKTAPTADDDVSDLSFAVFSCSNYRRIHCFNQLESK